MFISRFRVSSRAENDGIYLLTYYSLYKLCIFYVKQPH